MAGLVKKEHERNGTQAAHGSFLFDPLFSGRSQAKEREMGQGLAAIAYPVHHRPRSHLDIFACDCLSKLKSKFTS